MGLTFIASRTADEPGTGSGEATLSFTSGIDSTYNEYQFYYVNIHPETDGASFNFQVETDGTDYDHPMITTFFQAYHGEAGSPTGPVYSSGNDQATSGDGNGVFSKLAKEMGNGNDEAGSGVLTLYAPSNTTYVKHFTNTSNNYQGSNFSMSAYTAGYINIATAITRVQFKMSSGDIDAGTIYMYGVS